jgi:hypothetical protein
MKEASRKKADTAYGIRPEYDFDYSKAKPNPYAARLKGRAVAVVLDPDVASLMCAPQLIPIVQRTSAGRAGCRV